MPVEFLTAEQEARYGCFTGEPTEAELAQSFYLDARDWDLLGGRRGDHNRLGLAVQLTSARYLDVFPENLTAVPATVVTYLARQLQMEPGDWVERYEQTKMRHLHMAEIRATYGYHDFSEAAATFPLVRFLYARAWLSAERPGALFDAAVIWLKSHRVLLPGITVLERLVARVRDRVAEHVWQQLTGVLSPVHQARLERLVLSPEEGRQTPLDRLRRAPTRHSAPALLQALERLEEIRALGVGNLDLSGIPPSRLKVLANFALTAKAQTLRRMRPDRRAATLLAFARSLELSAHDDALDVLDLLLADLFAKAERVGKQERLRTLGDLDAAALTLAEATARLLSPKWGKARMAAYLSKQHATLEAAVTRVRELARPADTHYEEELLARYTAVRRFLPSVLRTITFAGTPAGRPVLDALAFLAGLEGQTRPTMQEAPLACVPTRWRRYVTPKGGGIDRKAYTLCVVERLQEELHRRNLFVEASGRWADPRARLLSGSAWEAVKPAVCQTLGRSLTPEPDLAAWAHELDAAYRRTAANLPSNTALRIERVPDPKTGRLEEAPVLTPLERLEEPASLRRLQRQVTPRLPQIGLPELVLEIEARTGFAAEFTHVSESRSRIADLPISLCAVLLAEACNLPLNAFVQEGALALQRERLLWVQQNYVRPETISAANARLVTFHQRIPLSQVWGGGEVASVDGLRFVVPVRTLNAGPNPKYFGRGRGITLINYTLNHFFGFNGTVVPGTLRDSLFILEGLLHQDPRLHPTQIMADSAGYSDIVFGLFALLGYRFSPRLADLGEARFWRVDTSADYGPLNGIARHRVNVERIRHHWEDVLRLAGSLQMGTVPASDVVRLLQGGWASDPPWPGSRRGRPDRQILPPPLGD
jgi:TnpA family transposase